MKRTPLIRHSSLRRSRMQPWRRDPEDMVGGDLRRYILLRDQSCVAGQLDPAHRCEGRDDTLDHVPGRNENAMGKRAPSDKWHLVRLCWGANVNGWASAHRDNERDYLDRVEPRA